MVNDPQSPMTKGDRHSMKITLSQFTDFGNDFKDYKDKHLGNIPNKIIYDFVQFLSILNLSKSFRREAEKYSAVLDLSCQQVWLSSLKFIFERSEFIKIKKIHYDKCSNKINDDPSMKNEGIYMKIFNKIKSGIDNEIIIEEIISAESQRIFFVIISKLDNIYLLMVIIKNSHRKTETLRRLLCNDKGIFDCNSGNRIFQAKDDSSQDFEEKASKIISEIESENVFDSFDPV